MASWNAANGTNAVTTTFASTSNNWTVDGESVVVDNNVRALINHG